MGELAGSLLAAVLLTPVPGSVTLEDDWLTQARLREPALADKSGLPAPDADAAGGCDGRTDEEYGFHTAWEARPWWQVDLVRTGRVARVVIHNRVGSMASRASRVEVLLSLDGQHFTSAYRHDGSVFQGAAGQPPLTIALPQPAARYVRLQVPGTNYLHFAEVEVYDSDGRNLARGQPATQSSLSQWSTRKTAGGAWPLATRQALERGRRLAGRLESLGVDVAPHRRALEALAAAPDTPDTAAAPAAYFAARQAVRSLALANPLLDFDAVVFIQRAPGLFPHLSDQHYGWWSRPGGGVYVLEGLRAGKPRVRCLTTALPPGNVATADLSHDGRRVLFAWCRHHPGLADERNKADKTTVPEDAFYHLFEIGLDGSGLRQLTRGRYDDFDARYLPNGDSVFLSTRKGCAVACSRADTERTLTADLPDSYVRCGGDNYRPVPVFTLHRRSADGATLVPISAFETFEYNPWVADDGRILYCRWDYIDRFNGHFFSLWATRPDGANGRLVYGNYTVRPQATMEPRTIPGSRKLLFTASAHHATTGGSLVLLDPGRGTEELAPLTRLTPEVPFPETESNVDMYYATPWPLSEDFYLVSWSNRRLPPHCRSDDSAQNPVNALGLYLYDRFGNLELLHRDPALSCVNPIPVRPRPAPFAVPDLTDWDGAQTGRLVLQNVYDGLPGVPAGTVRRLRVVGVPPKVQPHMNQPSLGVSHEEPGKFVLGTVPVEADGSAHFVVPSGVSLFFQALDADGQAVQTMRSLTYVQPGQILACTGCHEERRRAPVVRPNRLALRRPASRLTPGPAGTWPLRFDALVQPVLDRACVTCHQAGGKGARLLLTGGKAFDALLNHAGGDLRKLAHEKDFSAVNDCPARQSKLLAFLRSDPAHAARPLPPADRVALVTWMDLYAPWQGCFSAEQELALAALRAPWRDLLQE